MSSISTMAPPDKFRVVRWNGPERHLSVEGDFHTLAEASAHADALLPGSFNTAVFSCIGRCVYDGRLAADPRNRGQPLQVTRLAGLDDPKTRTGSYKRR